MAANGLSFSEALASITIDAALYDGDPFEYTTHAIGVIIDGNLVSTEVR